IDISGDGPNDDGFDSMVYVCGCSVRNFWTLSPRSDDGARPLFLCACSTSSFHRLSAAAKPIRATPAGVRLLQACRRLPAPSRLRSTSGAEIPVPVQAIAALSAVPPLGVQLMPARRLVINTLC